MKPSPPNRPHTTQLWAEEPWVGPAALGFDALSRCCRRGDGGQVGRSRNGVALFACCQRTRLAALMSSLWTPDGERPIRRPDPSPPRTQAGPAEDFDADYSDEFGDDMSEEELAQVTGELLSVPASAIVANHCIGFFQLAALHLSQQPPNLAEASLAIDALGAVVDKVGGRLGDDGETLNEALGQIRLAFVQVKAAADAQG
jgi:hypothetical protein